MLLLLLQFDVCWNCCNYCCWAIAVKLLYICTQLKSITYDNYGLVFPVGKLRNHKKIFVEKRIRQDDFFGDKNNRFPRTFSLKKILYFCHFHIFKYSWYASNHIIMPERSFNILLWGEKCSKNFTIAFLIEFFLIDFSLSETLKTLGRKIRKMYL